MSQAIEEILNFLFYLHLLQLVYISKYKSVHVYVCLCLCVSMQLKS